MKTRVITTIFAIAARAAMAVPGSAAAGSFERQAERFIGDLGASTESALANNASLSPAERSDKLNAFIDGIVDVPTIARFTMGRHWRRASEQQRADFTALFRNYLASSVSDRIAQLANAAIEIQKVVPVKASRSNDVLVMCRIAMSKGRSSLGIVWRVRETAAGPRLVDVIVDGISMAVVQREEFASVLSANNGDIGSFIAALREKTEEAGRMVAENAKQN